MDLNFPQRKQMRMKDYDYSCQGRYFITICAQDRLNYFGNIVDGIVYLNALGKIADHCIVEISQIYPSVIIPCKIVMPNHVHFIIESTDCPIANADDDAKQYTLQEKSKMLIPKIVQQYKSTTTKQIKRAFHAYYYPEDVNEPQEEVDKPIKSADEMHKGINGKRDRMDGLCEREDGLHERGDGLHSMQPLRWQRGYYDRIIRSEEEYRAIRKYIETNPLSYQHNEHDRR